MLTVNSREIAKMLGKRHDNFMRDIRRYITSLGDKANEYFIDGSYEDTLNKKRFCYEITVKGLDLIANRVPIGREDEFREKISEVLGENITKGSSLPEADEKYYTADEVAKILKCSERNVYRNIQSGKIKATEREILVPQVKKMVSETELENYKKERGIA